MENIPQLCTMTAKNAQNWIQKLALLPHPEGGYYREQFRSNLQIQREGSLGFRSACTSIYYLLEGDDFSAFHRLKSDEIWYFHTGSPLHISVLDLEGNLSVKVLSDAENGELSVVIPAEHWFASEVANQDGYALVSCAVAPGFEFSEFEMADAEKLSTVYPEHRETIRRLCR